MRVPLTSAVVVALELLASGAFARSICVTRAAVVCDSYSAMAKTEVLVPGEGCTLINALVPAEIADTRGNYIRIRTLPPKPELWLWIKPSDLACTALETAPAAPSVYQRKYLIEITGDNFVWKGGQRIGWVDARGPTFYWIQDLELTGPMGPMPKAGAKGQKVGGRDKTRDDVDNIVVAKDRLDVAKVDPAKPEQRQFESPKPSLEKTGDGFVWRSGQRIGWVDAAKLAFYPLDAIEVSGDSVRPKAGATANPIVGGDLTAAVTSAETRAAK
jgi:hypothetical protein